jgi:hypothetical protein
VIAQREEVVRVLTNGATWRHNCRDDHTMVLNRGNRWCSDWEMVLGMRRRDWSWGGAVDNKGCSHCTFYTVVGWQKAGDHWRQLQEMETGKGR